ncbi:MAG: SLATT domain-containing protein [Cytophagia bacterium]|nr:MAG: SLATT domain-containing protein [Cytophagia bacterium]TAG44003.1 MAG: SLATT domain-containing protein [Cytophagia bacterium]TAH30991.1 MAG: SLATT domain-containing protein [Cytophagales bacterium]
MIDIDESLKALTEQNTEEGEHSNEIPEDIDSDTQIYAVEEKPKDPFEELTKWLEEAFDFNKSGTPITASTQTTTQPQKTDYNEINKRREFNNNLIGDAQKQFQDLTTIGQGPSTISKFIEEEGRSSSHLEALNKKLFAKPRRIKTNLEDRPEIDKKLTYLKEKIDGYKKTYKGYENRSKNWAFVFKLLSSLLAAIVTVLLGINVTDTLKSYGVDWYINSLALIITASISIIGVIQNFYDAGELYIKYADTLNRLSQITDVIDYLTLSEDYITLEDVNHLKYEIDRIVASTQDYEIQVQADNDDVAKRVRKE